MNISSVIGHTVLIICRYKQTVLLNIFLKFWFIHKSTATVILVWIFDLRIFPVYGHRACTFTPESLAVELSLHEHDGFGRSQPGFEHPIFACAGNSFIPNFMQYLLDPIAIITYTVKSSGVADRRVNLGLWRWITIPV